MSDNSSMEQCLIFTPKKHSYIVALSARSGSLLSRSRDRAAYRTFCRCHPTYQSNAGLCCEVKALEHCSTQPVLVLAGAFTHLGYPRRCLPREDYILSGNRMKPFNNNRRHNRE